LPTYEFVPPVCLYPVHKITPLPTWPNPGPDQAILPRPRTEPLCSEKANSQIGELGIGKLSYKNALNLISDPTKNKVTF